MIAVQHGRIIIGHGPRHVERLLLAEVDALLPRDLADLALPVRIIVPSAALRRHLNRRLVQHRGAAVAGVVVQTLLNAATEIVQRAGQAVACHDAAFEALARRVARAHPVLRSSLEHLDDGYGAVVASVRDLLDAGLEPAHAEALHDKLSDLATGDLGPERLARASAIVDVAEAVSRVAAESGIRRFSSLQVGAHDLLEQYGSELLPARALLVHGFADLTALAGDLLKSIVDGHAGTVYLDRPLDPGDDQRIEAGAVFLERVLRLFSGLPVEEHSGDEEDLPRQARVVQAQDTAAQVRDAAVMIRALLDDGVQAEEIGICTRDLRPFIGALSAHFDRLGIPFSCPGAQVDGGAGERLVRALAELLERGEEAQINTWLTARSGGRGCAPATAVAIDLLALKRLGDLAQLDALVAVGSGVEIPVRERSESSGRTRNRRVEAESLQAEADRARALLVGLRLWPEEAAVGEHLARLMEILDLLGWSDDDPLVQCACRTLHELVAELQPLVTIERTTWWMQVVEAMEASTRQVPGGCGAGVQVLSVMEARALSFEHLFLLGVERGLFPRLVVEDALLPDTVRGRLAEVLPQVPVKSRGWVEDSYLFAQLCAASPSLYCGWGKLRDGSETARSPFLDRLLFSPRAEAVEAGDAGISCAFELAVEAARSETGPQLVPLIAAALAEGRARSGAGASCAQPERIARSRLDLLQTIETRLPQDQISPFWGLMERDLGRSRYSLSFLERVAGCPWQAFVGSVLKVRRLADPLFDFPEFSSSVRGDVVHLVLQRIVKNGLVSPPKTLMRATMATPTAVPWPDPQMLRQMVTKAVDRVLKEKHLVAPVCTSLLVEHVLPFLEVAREIEWPGAVAASVLGAELEGELDLEAADLPLFFRADRVDSVDGVLHFVDYKTGKPPFLDKKKEDTRRRHFLAAVREGRTLQVAGYVMSVDEGMAAGRYAYLSPHCGEIDDRRRLLGVEAGEEDAREAFLGAVHTLEPALRYGAFFPRTDRDPAACCDEWCEVREACIRGDSALRAQIESWRAVADRGRDKDPADARQAALQLWHLGEQP